MPIVALLFLVIAAAPPQTFRERRAAARAAYDQKRFADCEREFGALADGAPVWASPDESAYNAACCAALAGHADQAFRYLDRLLTLSRERRTTAADDAPDDPELAALKKDKRWKPWAAAVAKARQQREAGGSARFKLLYEADQGVRTLTSSAPGAAQTDADRRKEVEALLARGEAKTARDHLMAALIFQHGTSPSDFERAHALATRATELDPESWPAKQIRALTMDRWQVSLGKPQRYGTQLKAGAGGRLELAPLDPAFTDAQRMADGMPPLAELEVPR